MGGVGYGMSPMMMGMGMNPMMMGMRGMGPSHSHEEEPAGAIATTDVAAGIKASIVIDKLSGFETLDELAGHGVVVCPADNVEHDFNDNSMCSGGILSCCALHYDNEEVVLGGFTPQVLPGNNPAVRGPVANLPRVPPAAAPQGHGGHAGHGYHGHDH